MEGVTGSTRPPTWHTWYRTWLSAYIRVNPWLKDFPALRLGEKFEGLTNAIGNAQFLGQLFDGPIGLPLIVSQRQQGIDDVVPCGRSARSQQGRSARRGELVAQLQQQAFGGLLADARDLGQPSHVLPRHRMGQFVYRQSAQNGQGELGADAADLEQ